MISRQQHWETLYQERQLESVGWYQPHPTQSLAFIESIGLDLDAPIVDIGGGTSRLVDHLLDLGYSDVTVLDISPTALALAQERMGSRADCVTWIAADVTRHSFERSYHLWHDRAAFHFLIESADRDRYRERLRDAVTVGGHAILAVFALDGPEQCSGLPVQRYGPESLSRALGTAFAAVGFERETHQTPGGATQQFLFGHFRRGSYRAI